MHRAAVQRAMRAQSMEFNEHNVEYGYTYASAAIVPDGTPARANPDDIRIYLASTRPGSPLPHAWVEDGDGACRAIADLVAPGRFLLIAGEGGQAWVDAARAVAGDAGLPLDAIRIGHLDGDVLDPRCTWARSREIGAGGAMLVRPDRFVAWRSLDASADPGGELVSALAAVLGRTLSATVATTRAHPGPAAAACA
jgi:2,4-dichlorophenol 6-monooxygenase